MSQNPLRILVTRPAGQNQKLCAMLEELNCIPYRLPTLEIRPAAPAQLDQFKQRLKAGTPPDWLIFISANAVRHGWPLIAEHTDIVSVTKIAVVGPGSRKALREFGVTADAMPEKQFDSEGLLELPWFRQPANEKILIIRGVGGRPRLGDELSHRGASVEYGECYQRLLPKQGGEVLADWLNQAAVDLVTVSSRETLRNLFKLCPTDQHPALRKLTYLLLSKAIRTTTQELEITGSVTIAPEQSDQGFVRAIQQLQSGKL